MDIKSINNSFINGFIPNCLFYNASPEYNMSISNELEINKLKFHSSLSIDVNKIKYNNYYQSYEFFESKFPEVNDNIIGFSDVIDSMATSPNIMYI